MRWMQAGTGARLLLAISGLFAVAAVTTTGVMIETDRAGTIREVQQRNVVLAQMLEEHARRAFDISKASLLDLADKVMATGKPRVTPDIAARMAAWIIDIPQVFSFWVYGADGRVVYTTQQLDTAGLDYTDREYFKAHRDGTDLHIGRMTRGRVRQDLVLFAEQAPGRPERQFPGRPVGFDADRVLRLSLQSSRARPRRQLGYL